MREIGVQLLDADRGSVLGSDLMLVQFDGTMSGISKENCRHEPGISLAPCGLVIERIESETDRLLLVARPISTTAACPSCSGISAHIHSHNQRALADLPSQGRLVRIRLRTRRFRCAVAECHQKIFTERLEKLFPVWNKDPVGGVIGVQTGLNSMLVQFDGTMSGISKENRRHEPWNLVGTVWACYRAYRIRNGQAFACSSTDIDDGGLSEL